MPIIDAVLRDSLYLTDTAGTAITGADTGDFTSTATLLGSATTAAVTISERSGGKYDVSFTPTAAGRWELSVVYDDGITQRRFEDTYEVTEANDAATIATAVYTRIGSGRITVTSPLDPDANITVVKGDAATLTWSSSGWSITEGNSISLTVTYAGTETTFTGTRTSATAVSVSLTEEQTDALTAGRQHYAYQIRDTTADTTLAVGLMTVRAS